VLVEHARSLEGIADAVHAEYGAPGTSIVSLLACSLAGKTITIELAAASRLRAVYGCETAAERTTCSYGLDPRYAGIASRHGIRVAATDDTGEVRAVERVDHPFFVGTLYQPQLTSSAAQPHPIFAAFVAAVVARREAR
jgi:CTP synthase (UTP-ammonia lyase)